MFLFISAMKAFILFATLLTSPAIAQTPDETAVKATITRLFDGMGKADSTMLKPLFAPGARLQTVQNKQGTVSVKEDPIASFIASVGKTKAGALDERLSGMNINIDGDLATVWTPYSFYYNGQQSHCGANAFTLVRIGSDWKILTIIDTRRKCE